MFPTEGELGGRVAELALAKGVEALHSDAVVRVHVQTGQQGHPDIWTEDRLPNVVHLCVVALVVNVETVNRNALRQHVLTGKKTASLQSTAIIFQSTNYNT